MTQKTLEQINEEGRDFRDRLDRLIQEKSAAGSWVCVEHVDDDDCEPECVYERHSSSEDMVSTYARCWLLLTATTGTPEAFSSASVCPEGQTFIESRGLASSYLAGLI